LGTHRVPLKSQGFELPAARSLESHFCHKGGVPEQHEPLTLLTTRELHSLIFLGTPYHNMTEKQSPRGFQLTANAVSEESWRILQEWMDTGGLLGGGESVLIPWEVGAQNRKVAQFGFRYDYDRDIVDTTTPTPPIPPTLYDLLDVPSEYTQCIINTYEADILIPWHKDDLAFGPTILVYSFGEARPLLMRHADNHDLQCEVIPTHCSKYVLSQSARYDWEHMVPTGSAFRVSFTFRSLKDG